MNYIDYANTWFQFWCPYCQAENWVNDGDTTDITVIGVAERPVKCRNCKKNFWLGPGDEDDEYRKCYNLDDPEDYGEEGILMKEVKE